MTPPPRECVACGKPNRPGQRWCSTACFYMEDGYPDDEPEYAVWPADDEDLDEGEDA